MRSGAWGTCLATIAVAAIAACSSAGAKAPAGGDDGASGAAARNDDRPGVKDAGYDSTPSLDSGLGVMSFSPDQSYSGFDGEHTFQVPIAVYDSSDDLVVSATDPSAATVEPVALANPMRSDGTYDSGKYFMVTIKQTGTITIVASSQGSKVQGAIAAAAYTSAQWKTGEYRYLNGGTNGDPPCTQCHGGENGIDHSPAAMASADDEKIRAVITTGISVAGFPIKEPTKGHRWTVTQDELDGLVTYLRGLTPRGFTK